MASSRDDFIIAIRSAFLKKSTQQKFSLLTLVFLSIFIIILSNLNFKPIQQLRIILNEIVYRSSFIASIPENLVKNSYLNVKDYSNFYIDYKKNKNELENLKSQNILSEIIKSENKELKNLIEDYTLTTDKILAKVIADRKSPFLKSIIINKGSAENIKIGTNIYDKSYLIGRVIEVNYKTSRVLLLSDLNSNVPVTVAPQNIQAIISGKGNDYGQIKYIKSGLSKNFTEKSIIYTSGTGAIFKSGTPIGKLIIKDEVSKNWDIEFYSDFSQLKYVFAEVEPNKKNIKNSDNTSVNNDQSKKQINAKIKILKDELNIIEMTNFKLAEEYSNLKNKINDLNSKILLKDSEIADQKNIINQFNVNELELEFLRLNLLHGHKCRKTFINIKGFNIGTSKYKECVLNKGIKINE